MDLNSSLTFTVLRPLVIIFHVIAIVSTIFRLTYRYHIHRLWWEDFWAFYSMLWTVLLLVTFIMSTSPTMHDYNPKYVNFIYIGSILCVNHAVWGARLSVAVTIVRLLATGTIRIVAKVAVCLFVVFSLTSMIQTLLVCGPPSTSKFLCSNPSVPGYFQLTITLIGDLWLIALPAYLLTKMNLSKRHHRLIQTIFACEIIVTCVGTVHSIFVIKKNFAGQGLSSEFEVSVSLIVCNLLFLVTYLYRIIRRGGEESTDTESKSETTGDPPRSHNAALESNPAASAGLTSSFLSTAWTATSGSPAEADERRAAVSEPAATRETFLTQKFARGNIFKFMTRH